MQEYILTRGTVSIIRKDIEGILEAEARGYVLQGDRPSGVVAANPDVKPISDHPKIKGKK